MTKNDLIDWLMLNLDCTRCPRYSYCQRAKPNSCSGVLREAPDVAQIALDCAEQRAAILRFQRRMYGNDPYYGRKLRELRVVIRSAKALLRQGGEDEP